MIINIAIAHCVFVFSRYYNSMFDVMKLAGLNYPSSLNETEKYNYVGDLAVHIERLATAVAQAVYWQATNSTAHNATDHNSTHHHNCAASNVTVSAPVMKYYYSR